MDPENTEGNSAESPLSVVNIDGLASELAEQRPEVSEHTVQAEQAKADERAAQYADLRDADGYPFDPAVHVTDSDGAPALTKTGKLRKRPGRKGTNSAKAGGSHIGGQSATTQNVGQSVKRREAGRHAARMMVGLAYQLGGEEWKPVKDEKSGIDEMGGLEMAFGDYFEAKEMDDLPPGIALTLICASYALPRFMMPKTKGRLSRLKDGIASKWLNWRSKKKKKKEIKEEAKEAEKPEEHETQKMTMEA